MTRAPSEQGAKEIIAVAQVGPDVMESGDKRLEKLDVVDSFQIGLEQQFGAKRRTRVTCEARKS